MEGLIDQSTVDKANMEYVECKRKAIIFILNCIKMISRFPTGLLDEKKYPEAYQKCEVS